MPDPTGSTATAALHAVGATALAGALTGLDYWAILGGFAGALLAMSRQDAMGPWRRGLAVVSVTLLALFVTWFIADSMPAVFRAAGWGEAPVLQKGRALVAWMIGYFAQDIILPAAARALNGLAGRVARQAEGEGKQ
ncbi:MAG: putative phage holin [Rhodocyclaceae bacterium]|nr:putative phage holin [Rhodocyclaceae bacterium]